MMKAQTRRAPIYLAIALVVFESTVALAQDVEHGERLIRRWCVECHANSASTSKAKQAISFESIAAKPGISAELIANFLMLPHATMPNPPIRKNDAEDIAAFIMRMKK